MRYHLLDAEGENRAVRSFLLQYSCGRSIAVGEMRRHMEMSGWGGSKCLPKFLETCNPLEHLTKAAAQLWIRHLFSLEEE